MTSIEPLRITDSPLSRRNPTLKLVLLFIVSGAMLLVYDPFTPAVLYLAGVAAVLVWGRVPARTLAMLHLPFVGFGLGLLIVNALTRPGDALVDLPGLRVTAEGLSVGASLALRTLVIGILSIGFITSTDGVQLMTSLHQQARLSPRITYAVLAGYRMLQEMPQEWQIIRHAQAVRAPLRRNRRPSQGLRSPYWQAAFTLLVVSLRKGERMSQSLEARGLGLTPRTVWRPVLVRRLDWIMTVAVLIVLGSAFAVSASFGFLAGPDALFG
jgi:energy-coupling factor transport system permease protein